MLLSKIHEIIRILSFYFYTIFIVNKKFPYIKEKYLSKYNIKSIEDTLKVLSHDKYSIGRFGDGEISWMMNKKNNVDDFEKKSLKLSRRLYEIAHCKDEKFLVCLPDTFVNTEYLTKTPKRYWRFYLTKNFKNILKLFDTNKIYYNTSVTRPYIDFNYRHLADITFKSLKKIWDNKNVLIIEGSESRLGYKNDLFSNSKNIQRIECPSRNAFESYDDILNCSVKFLNNNPDYIAFISLGPTATILAYDLFKLGYRAIDIGHVDVEYEWYLIGAKERINLKYKYVNEVKGGHSALTINDDSYYNQIYKIIE